MFSTVAFTYKVPVDAVSGEYMVRIFSAALPIMTRYIRVIDYSSTFMIKATTTSATNVFMVNDKVSGYIQLVNLDGSAFNEAASFDLVANFKSSSVSQRN